MTAALADANVLIALTVEDHLHHRQVTDAYLAALARHFGGRLVTIDRGLAAQHPDTAQVIPV